MGQGVSVSAQGATDETISVTADTTAIENKVLSPLGESSNEAPQEMENGVSEESLPKADATLGSVDESENVTSQITSSSKMITGTLPTEGKTNTSKILRDGEIDAGTYGTAPWMLDFEGVLHIRDGEFDEGSVPWKEHADLIEKIVFEGTVIACENSNGLFSDLPRLTEIDGLDKLDVSRVTSMRDMFSGDRNLTTLDVSGWNTANVIDMGSMFQCASSLTTLDVSEWNTANVKDMSFMFDNAPRLTTLDVSEWNTANVKDMTAMFRYDNSLTTLDVRNWNTVSVTHLESMLFARNMRSITLGPNSKFRIYVNLVGPKENDSYTGKWKYESDLEGHAPETPLSLTTDELMSSYYEKKPGTYVWETKDPVAGADVTVYYEDDKGAKISEDVVLKGNVGDYYTSEQKAIPGYTFSKVEGAATGKFTDTAQTVKYVYMKDKEVPSAPDDIDSGVYGTAPWRLDGEGTLHISAGAFNEDAVPWKNHAEIIKKIVFEGTVIAYEDSNGLFSDLPQVTEINGLDKLDVSSVT
ncbi:BspA family leucine-rich repeat surface protein, partial [Enterococcus faecalis]